MKIQAAPLQGFTEAVWRNIHEKVFGGIDTYFTPFIRYEHGEIRNKDIRDIEKKNNSVKNLVPQLIASTPAEMQPLLQLIKAEGYKNVDINMGCSFPLQARQKRGAGILPHPQLVADLMNEVKMHPELTFSVKMRLGWENKDEWKEIVPILNETPLSHVTMHPRLGREAYKFPADTLSFAAFYEECKHPVVYNGDVCTLTDIERIEKAFPALHAIMVGRGLLANPAIGLEHERGSELTGREMCDFVQRMHDELYATLAGRLQGNTQILGKLKPYWEYLLPQMEKRLKKAILKAGTAEKFVQAVNNALAAGI